MIPTFDPGPNPFGAPAVYIGGFGSQMVAVSGEVADGLITHPFTTRQSLLELTLPAIDRGLDRVGKTRDQFDVIAATLVVTADTEEEFARVKQAAREQLAFYGSTPAYKPTLDCHGWGDLHRELNAQSKEGKWVEMAALITDEILETIAVVGPPDSIAAALRARLDGIADGVSLTNNRAPGRDERADPSVPARDVRLAGAGDVVPKPEPGRQRRGTGPSLPVHLVERAEAFDHPEGPSVRLALTQILESDPRVRSGVGTAEHRHARPGRGLLAVLEVVHEQRVPRLEQCRTAAAREMSPLPHDDRGPVTVEALERVLEMRHAVGALVGPVLEAPWHEVDGMATRGVGGYR
jgi:hypothetical protein